MQGNDKHIDVSTGRGSAPVTGDHTASAKTKLTIDALRRDGFEGFLTFEDLRDDVSAVPSSSGGVYVVVRASPQAPAFLDENRGGHFKGRNPTELVQALERKWVPGTQIVYVGKANVLQRRLKQYADFGSGRPVGHWGGRYIWQLADSGELRVAWKTCAEHETPARLECDVVRRFKESYGRLPFANIADPSVGR